MNADTAALARRARDRAVAFGRAVPWPLLAAAFAGYVIVQGHQFFMVPKPRTVSVDEGYIAAFALRLLHGKGLPYVDAVSQRGPVTYWLAAVACAFDQTSFLPMRVLALVVALFSGFAMFAVGTLSGKPFVGALALIAFAVVTTVTMGPHAGVGYNGELASLPFTMTGVALAVGGLRSRRTRFLLGAGACVALGALCKQLAAIFIVPLMLFTWQKWGEGRALSRLRKVGWLLAGAAIPVALIVVLYALAGHVRELWYWGVRYNSTIYMAPVTAKFRRQFLLHWFQDNAYSLTVWVAIGLWGWMRGGYARLFAAGALAAIVATLAPSRPWENYYLYAVPWLALLFATAVDTLLGDLRGRSALLLSVCLVLEVASAEQLRTWKGGESEKRWRDLDMPRVCAYIDQVSAPKAPLFVWGFLGEYYVECRRLPASRYVIPAPVAGWVPWFPELSVAEEDRLAAPGTREQLIADLTASKPDVILDAPYASMAGRSILRYALLRDFVVQNYDVGARLGAMTAYVRRRPAP